MALKKSEKNLIGIMMIVGGLGLVGLVGLPQWDQYQANNFQMFELQSKLQEAQASKENLTTRIQLLEQRIAPPDVEIRKYTSADKERQIKEILDDVVRTATRTSNKFISLEPKEVPPVIPPPPPPENNNQQASNNSEPAPPPPALLDTFGYELSIRGTYDSVQNFLRAMDQNKELMELSSIVVENETATADQHDDVDYSAPIRLTAVLRLVMQPGGSP
jgi:hypothetical protein